MNQVATVKPSILNGIDTELQGQTMKAIRDDLNQGDVLFHTVNRWEGGTHTQSRVSAFDTAGGRHKHAEEFTVETDLPKAFHGSDRGPAPTEHALQSLAACMTTTMVYHCAAQGIEVRSVESEIEGKMNAAGFIQLDGSVRKGFSEVRARFHIDADAPKQELQRLLQASPLFDVFSNGVPIVVELDE